jgi:hypothetical protein
VRSYLLGARLACGSLWLARRRSPHRPGWQGRSPRQIQQRPFGRAVAATGPVAPATAHGAGSGRRERLSFPYGDTDNAAAHDRLPALRHVSPGWYEVPPGVWDEPRPRGTPRVRRMVTVLFEDVVRSTAACGAIRRKAVRPATPGLTPASRLDSRRRK